MGYRTVVMLNNDLADRWSNDPQLGELIMLEINKHYNEDSEFKYGNVAEVVHADTVTLAKLDLYSGFTPLAYTTCRDQAPELSLLADAAHRLGYNLTKKRVKKV